MRIENENERNFYEIEAANNNWSLRELDRQFDSGLYERLILSRNKEAVKQLAEKGQIIEKPSDIIKDPYILEFVGLPEKAIYSESKLENQLITELETFLLELGKGFTFVGRQVRFTFDEEHFRVDLVFYNRLLRCFVLIDLKIGKLKHQDLGQMQMYVNYYDRFVKTDDENKTIGIILCKDKKDTLVEITLPEGNNQIFASRYQTILPSKEELKQLIEK
jgi:predicted nuclease of restriction endonuclease-like (RecB) superfamily